MFKEKNQLDEVKVFKDPVHRYVRVKEKVIWDLIATPEFQRLRRIKQLGTTFFTFHGAEHSRFNHSLGVYEIVRRIIKKLKTLPIGKKRRSSLPCVLLFYTMSVTAPFPIPLKKFLTLITSNLQNESF